MLALKNKQRKTHELWLVATTLLKNFFKVTWAMNECQREATQFKQSVTVHEKSRKAEPFNVHWKRVMKLISSC